MRQMSSVSRAATSCVLLPFRCYCYTTCWEFLARIVQQTPDRVLPTDSCMRGDLVDRRVSMEAADEARLFI